MKKDSKQPQQPAQENKEQKEPAKQQEYVTGEEHPASRAEQGPDVPPQERTAGIP